MRLYLSITFCIINSLSYSQIGEDTLKTELPLNYNSSTLNSDSLLKTKNTSFKSFEIIKVQNNDSLDIKHSMDTVKSSIQKSISTKTDKVLNERDSLLSKGKSEIKSLKPKVHLFVKSQLKAIKPKGSISVGYEYGVLPFVVGDRYPLGGFKTEGNLSFLLVGVPLELTYYYTEIKNVIGLNNYFRFSFDTDRYKEQLGETIDRKDQLAKGQLSKLQLQQQQLMQKMEYLKLLKQNSGAQLSALSSIQNSSSSLSTININDSLTSMVDTAGMASIFVASNVSTVVTDSSKLTDILNNIYDYNGNKDSIENEYSYYMGKYDSISEMILKTQAQIEQIKNTSNNSSSLTSPYLSKVQKFLGSIKKFEIGLCNPSYSTFLVNNIPLQGVNIELAKNNNFFAFTYGTTINNLSYNTNTLQGAIQGARNLYNYFDFGNLEAGRKIISIKGGGGAQDNTHLYAGILIGKGRADYLLPVVDESSSVKEGNMVLELDGKYKFSEQLTVDFVLGKSSINEGDLTMQQMNKAINQIFSHFRSYAALTKINFFIKKTSTKITFSTRWIDPYFKSFGVGFLRSDNLRYEAKVEQPISKRLKYTIAYRKDEDNLLKLYDYKNTLQSINNALNFRLNRQFNIRLIYAPLFRVLKSGSAIIKDQNNISTAVLSYTPKMKKGSVVLNTLYSRYIISGDSMDINFENFTFTDQFVFKSGFNTGVNISWFKNNLRDTINNNTYMGVIDAGFKSDKGQGVSLGAKIAYKKGLEIQYGFVLKMSVKIYKSLFWEAQAEKILIGDYYNSIITKQIEKFPYYCNSRLILNF